MRNGRVRQYVAVTDEAGIETTQLRMDKNGCCLAKRTADRIIQPGLQRMLKITVSYEIRNSLLVQTGAVSERKSSRCFRVEADCGRVRAGTVCATGHGIQLDAVAW